MPNTSVKTPMTKQDALQKAQKLWGPYAEVSDRDEYKWVGAPGVFGSGNTWEEAFADAGIKDFNTPTRVVAEEELTEDTWLREDSGLLYTLMYHGSRRGKPEFRNRIWLQPSFDKTVPAEEREQFVADLYEFLQRRKTARPSTGSRSKEC